jgi:misacylated tRNA(Ala) deacylase
MMTDLLFREDAYLRSAEAKVIDLTEAGGIVCDRSIFYAAAGGQPGDQGSLSFEGGVCRIVNAIYDDQKRVVLVPEPSQAAPQIGGSITQHLDWERRYRHMRAHTLMHLLCASVPFPVTGGAISDEGGRIDFDIPEGQLPNKELLTARLNELVAGDHPVSSRWISDAEMQANSHLIRTMSVKPPMGTGQVRLVMIGEDGSIDLQPCGGTHVLSTGEIGPVQVARIENKGKINRRIRVVFA